MKIQLRSFQHSRMSAMYYDSYDGSKIFVFLSNKIGLPIDLTSGSSVGSANVKLYSDEDVTASLHGKCYFDHVHVIFIMYSRTPATLPHFGLHIGYYRSSYGDNAEGNIASAAKVDKIPSPLEYFAYTLAFQTLMCGPVVFYSDYIKFIEGARVDGITKDKWSQSEPSPRRAVSYKVGGSVAAAVLYLALAKKYPLTVLEELTDPTSEVSRSWSALYLLWYAYLSTLVVRCKYYHAWLLSEAICNNCGMGFNGYDANGTPKWDKMSNIDVFGFEFAQNFREAVGSWNKNTNAWLRGVAYERGGRRLRTARVYALSALWHGFHPGYYLTFFAGGLFTVASKKMRAVVRPMFLESRPKKLFYDTLTFVTTRIAMTYATVPFILLHLTPSLAFYGKFYYSLHFIALGALLLPSKSKGFSNNTTNLELQPTSLKGNKDMLSSNDNFGKGNGKLKVS
ncbi:unnamed protein product [Parnassius apollo]|uniref:(apollo) hypothetical protein n=1 Tax=Parnassius apollo TaxID=110799 RepID=A0A8S3YCL1_PARAO|nr:unnamed protein product [Parnassius apollo]